MKHLPLIRNDQDLSVALRELEGLIEKDPSEGSLECDQIEALTVLIEAYEAKHHALPPASPVEVVRFMMDQNGLTAADLGRLFGSRSRASEFLTGKRSLSLGQINKLRTAWGLSADLLIEPARPANERSSMTGINHVWGSSVLPHPAP